MKIRIKNLKLRTVVGIYAWERSEPQDVIINIEMEFEGSRAAETDNIEDTVDYKTLKKQIIAEVESSRCNLIEKLAGRILSILMNDPKVQKATVEVDKPHALRFADSVSVELSEER
jgi:D-erythro-7,8-dihydroneopterin triphosphate epimerase